MTTGSENPLLKIPFVQRIFRFIDFEGLQSKPLRPAPPTLYVTPYRKEQLAEKRLILILKKISMLQTVTSTWQETIHHYSNKVLHAQLLGGARGRIDFLQNLMLLFMMKHEYMPPAWLLHAVCQLWASLGWHPRGITKRVVTVSGATTTLQQRIVSCKSKLFDAARRGELVRILFDFVGPGDVDIIAGWQTHGIFSTPLVHPLFREDCTTEFVQFLYEAPSLQRFLRRKSRQTQASKFLHGFLCQLISQNARGNDIRIPFLNYFFQHRASLKGGYRHAPIEDQERLLGRAVEVVCRIRIDQRQATTTTTSTNTTLQLQRKRQPQNGSAAGADPVIAAAMSVISLLLRGLDFESPAEQRKQLAHGICHIVASCLCTTHNDLLQVSLWSFPLVFPLLQPPLTWKEVVAEMAVCRSTGFYSQGQRAAETTLRRLLAHHSNDFTAIAVGHAGFMSGFAAESLLSVRRRILREMFKMQRVNRLPLNELEELFRSSGGIAAHLAPGDNPFQLALVNALPQLRGNNLLGETLPAMKETPSLRRFLKLRDVRNGSNLMHWFCTAFTRRAWGRGLHDTFDKIFSKFVDEQELVKMLSERETQNNLTPFGLLIELLPHEQGSKNLIKELRVKFEAHGAVEPATQL